MKFENREEAGSILGDKLKKYQGQDLLILGIPRGGIVVAKSIQNKIGGTLGILITKKIGFPGNPEYAIGAVAEDGSIVLSEPGKNNASITTDYIEKEIEVKKREIERRLDTYRYRLPGDLSNKTIIVVDDGIATGMTVFAALQYLHGKNAKKIILAVPVAPADTITRLQSEADEVLCLYAPKIFFSVGQFYRNFEEVFDKEVIAALHGEE